MSDRAAQVEVDHRVLEIAEAIACGLAKRAQLIQLAKEKEWPVSEQMVDQYIKRAKEMFKERKLGSIDTIRRKRVKQLEHLAYKNYAKGDYQESRHCIKALADIEGIVASRFADKDKDEGATLGVVSRFKGKWGKVSGE